MKTRLVGAALLAVIAASSAAQDQPPPAKPAPPRVERRLADRIDRLAVSGDGAWLAASDVRGALELVSVETGEQRILVPEGPAPSASGPQPTMFQHLLFTADGSVLVAVPGRADDGACAVRFISVADGKELRTLDVSSERERGTNRNAGGNTLHQIDAGPGGSKVRLLRQSTVEVWDAASGKKTESAKNSPYSQRNVHSRDGALTGGGATTVFWVLEAASRKELWKQDRVKIDMKGKNVDVMTEARCRVLGFTSDARLLLVFAEIEETKNLTKLTGKNLDSNTKKTNRIEAYASADGKPAWRRDLSQQSYPWGFCATGDVVAAVDDGKLLFIDATSGQTRDTAPSSAKYECVDATGDGLTFWAGTTDGRLVKAKTFPAPKGK